MKRVERLEQIVAQQGVRIEAQERRIADAIMNEREARNALDRLMESKFEYARASVDKAELSVRAALDKSETRTEERFVAHNQFREQIKDERGEYVTRVEMRWLITTVLALAVAVAGLYFKVN